MKLLVLLCFALSLVACDEGTTPSTGDDGPPVLSSGNKSDDDEYDDEGWLNIHDDEPEITGDADATGSTDEDDWSDDGWSEDDDWSDDDDWSGEADAGPTDEDVVDEVDPWAPAKDVTLHRVVFDESLKAPSYEYPYTGTGFSLGGTEFWQKWSGGENPTYSFLNGTEYGRRCMLASAKRFEAIMAEPSEALKNLKLDSNWSGSFFNWNDDYSQSDWGDGSSARLWAWRTTLIKWISQTNKDGSCYLPTQEMVDKLVVSCQSKADSSNGEIVGCKAP
ncbi:MAG: hypothetical protein ACPGU1_13500 [Myxococcota bacterium]